MTQTKLAHLPARAVLAVSGDDRVSFLQGLVSNDIAALAEGGAAWAALLTPQGKYLADFFVIRDGARLLLDVQTDQAEDLARRLLRFRLRMQVVVEPVDLAVHAAWDGEPCPGGIVAPDPRLPDAGWRVLTQTPAVDALDWAEWDRHRLRLGLPDGTRDMEIDKTVLLEAGFDELHGVSWSKGCYMGQELTARTKYRGLLKRRLVPVAVQGPLPAPGTPVLHDGQEVGTMRSGRDAIGLALLRLDAIGGDLACGAARLLPRILEWMQIPAGQTRS